MLNIRVARYMEQFLIPKQFKCCNKCLSDDFLLKTIIDVSLLSSSGFSIPKNVEQLLNMPKEYVVWTKSCLTRSHYRRNRNQKRLHRILNWLLKPDFFSRTNLNVILNYNRGLRLGFFFYRVWLQFNYSESPTCIDRQPKSMRITLF